jgi:CheY-like chemotaxis protein
MTTTENPGKMVLMNEPGYVHSLVMLVDDCSTDNFVNQRMLQHYSFSERTLVYTSSRKALEHVREMAHAEEGSVEIPSIIFLDLNMPMLNGHQFIAEYAKLPAAFRAKCRIVVLTSSMDPSDMLAAIRHKEVIAYISKPMIKNNLDELSGTIKELTGAAA